MAESKKWLRAWDWQSSIRVKNGNQYTIEQLKDLFEEKICGEFGVKATVTVDTLKTGKLLDSTTWPCLVIKSIDHSSDYNYIVMSYSTQGIYGLFDFFCGGSSTNASRINDGNAEHSTLTGTIIGKVRKAMVSDAKLEEEKFFYTAISDAIDAIFN